MEGKISSELQIIELRKRSLRQIFDQLHDRASSILLLTLRWKEIEDHFDSIHTSIEDRVKELHSIEESVDLKLVDVRKREKELEAVQASVKEREEELEKREIEWIEKSGREVEAVERKLEEIKDAEEKLELFSRRLDERADELRVAEREVSERLKRVELKEKECEERLKELAWKDASFREFEVKELKFEEECKELRLKKKQVKEQFKELDFQYESFNRRVLELQVKERKFEEQYEELTLKEKQFFNELELKEKQVEKGSKELDFQFERFNRQVLEFEVKERKFEEECKELRLEEKQLKLKEKKVEEQFKELDFQHDSFNRRVSELQVKERKFEEHCEELRLKHKQLFDELELKGKQVEERSKELDLYAQNYGRLTVELEMKENKFEEHCKELEKQSLDGLKFKEKQLQLSKELASKDENFSQRVSELEVKEKKFEQQRREFRLKEKQFFSELELKEEEVENRSKELALKGENLRRQALGLEMKEKELEEQHEKLRLKDEKFLELELKEKQIQAQYEEVELENKKFMDRFQELQLKESQLEERCKEFELKEKKFVNGCNTHVKIEPPSIYVTNNAMDYSMDTNIHFSVNMDGKSLQIYLNEHHRDDDSIRNEILTALGFSSDPAKVVLDAMQGFYPPRLRKGDMEFEDGVVRKTCILLLEQLMKISPVIKPDVKKEAMKLAFVWMTKMKVDAEHSLEVLGFLQLLASYGLADAFDADELLTQLEIVAQHHQALELFRVLGSADKISGFIQNLIRKKRQLEAIRFIYVFELVHEFPPVPLLKDYLQGSKRAAKKMKMRNKSVKGEIEATDKRIADIRCVLRCIECYKIEYEPPLGRLKQLIDYLEEQNSIRKADFAALAHKIQTPLRNKKKYLPSTVAACKVPSPSSNKKKYLPPTGALCKVQTPFSNKKKYFPPTGAAVNDPAFPTSKSASTTSLALSCIQTTYPSSGPTPKTQSPQWSGSKRPTFSAEDDQNASSAGNQETSTAPFHLKIEQSSLGNLPSKGKEVSSSLDPQPPRCFSSNMRKEDLRLFLKHEIYDSAPGEVAAALRLVGDSGKLVLDVMKDSFPFNLKRKMDGEFGVSKKSCILLLQQLRRVTPQINPKLKEEARIFAFDWERKLEKNCYHPLEAICFLQFLAAYRLATTFRADKLLGYLVTDHWCSEAPDLCQVLGLENMIPNFIQDLIKKERRIEAVKYIYALDVVDKFPPVPILKDHLSNFSKKNAEGVKIGAIEKEIKALKDVVKCIVRYKIYGLPTEILKERIMQVEKQREKVLNIQQSKADSSPRSWSRSKLDQQVPPASAPTSNIFSPNTPLQQHSEEKRPRIHVSSNDLPKASVCVRPSAHSEQPAPEHPPQGSFLSQGVDYINAPTGHCTLDNSMQSNPHKSDVISSYHWVPILIAADQCRCKYSSKPLD